MVGTGLLVLIVLSGSYLLYISPALARVWGRRIASEHDFLPLNLLFFVLYALFILVVGGFFLLFYFAALFVFIWREIPPNIMFTLIGIVVLFLEYHLLRGFWEERGVRNMRKRLSKDLF